MASYDGLNIIAEMNGYTLAKATERENIEAKERGETVRWFLHKGTTHSGYQTLEEVEFFFDQREWIQKDITRRHWSS